MGNPLFSGTDCPTSGFAVSIRASGWQGRKLPHRSCPYDPDEKALVFRAQSLTKQNKKKNGWTSSLKNSCVRCYHHYSVYYHANTHRNTHTCVFVCGQLPPTHPSREACHGNGSSQCLLEGRQLRGTWQTVGPCLSSKTNSRFLCFRVCACLCLRAKTVPVGQIRIPCPALGTWLALAHTSK